MRRKKARWKRVLHDMRLNLAGLLILVVMASAGGLLLRTALLRNSQSMGIALSSNYAAEASNNLSIFETLLSFGTASLDKQVRDGSSPEELLEWMDLYFQQLGAVLGQGVVDPYLVLNGEILAANPWEGDDTYDVYSTEWYQKAVAADGEAIFTNVYTDAIFQKPVITAAQKSSAAEAVLAFDVFPENFAFRFTDQEISAGDSFFLCDGEGTVIFCHTDLDVDDDGMHRYLGELIQQIENGDLAAYDDFITDSNGEHRAVYYTVMDNGWYSIVTSPYSNILSSMNWFYLAFAAIIALFLLMVAAMTWRDVRINARMERTNETVRVLGNFYYALYRVDYGQGTYETIKGSDYVRARLPETGSYEDLQRVIGEVIQPEAYDEYMRSFSRESIQSLVSRRVRDFGGEFLRRFGEEYRWVSVRVLFDESLAPEEVVLSFREVEEEKQGQLRERKLLQDALELARQNEAAKQSFFSSMSHDMRTPLNAIIGLSQLAAQHAGDPAQTAEYLEKIHYSSKQLLELINDILDMSRMEQGKVILNNQWIDLKACVENCMDAFHFQAEREDKTLSVSVQVRDSWVLADPFRIGQVINNLVSNAMKFTSPGDSVSVSLTQLESPGAPQYKLVVSDSGMGMEADFLPHLFEPYSREMRFEARKVTGTGLGMPITKNLITQMNGEIRVESEPGKGTTFTIILPFTAAREEAPGYDGPEEAPAPAEQPEPVSLEGLRVLLAEDNEVNMEITTELLDMNGVQVTQAWNGREAMEIFRDSEPFFFDAILMDMQMPEMDGCESARRIRAMHRPDADIPIIAVTANAFAEDVAATTAAGINAHVSKPIDFSLLCQTLGKWIRKDR
ncbi:hybrid sensor histidine kinase/response regulator [Dysosmobacter sp.]|uniref:hybrid sensor histidine kinase/response regulator n=1 Tax=Dysosmobacter sp. TaxID=2591382 RepID=UPI002A9DEF48|nr:ATP-binding protein [Dysosmobacter sp.]MDY5509350.1 ATP-binding protein [Dysosmobacter sp.]